MNIDASNLSKKNLMETFSSKSSELYEVKLFEEEGFSRRKCKICGRHFWSISKRETCDDSSHTEYTFFKEKPSPVRYAEFWKKFADFFRKEGHAEVSRYPVVSRWRQDLYFTIASIQDFQRLENGSMSFEYGENPLIVPQICLRFSDIDNVGITGRHFTGFMMAGQHAFDWPHSGYWKDKTIELNFRLLTSLLKIPKEEITYNEDVWAMPDFSGFGPSLESFSKGSELSNSVFTQFELQWDKVQELKSKVVDVGWGFERLLWFQTGFDNAYEAVFHSVIEKLKSRISIERDTELFRKFAEFAGELDVDGAEGLKKKENEILKKIDTSRSDYEKKIKPMQAFYALLDHSRTLLFSISDGALPSNVGGGYNLRIILRRAFDFMERYELGVDLIEVMHMQAEELKPLYPELSSSLETLKFEDIMGVEKERYSKSKENARKTVESILSKRSTVEKSELRTMYESNGITPEFISSIAAEMGKKIELPDTLYEGIIKGDMNKQDKKKPKMEISKNLPKTKQLYYNFENEAEAKILFSDGRNVVLDKTPFYPEGGGQASDIGTINGIGVIDVQKVGDVIVHEMEGDVVNLKEFAEGAKALATVNVSRREKLIAHHTATHLISAAARIVLGKHAWQEGARKDPDKAHIDVAHYNPLQKDEILAIERMVNEWLYEGIKVNLNEMDRGDAEKKYGFSIYQGHGVASKKMRIITITSSRDELIDAEACGGLHAIERASLLGIVKIINSYRLHDGIDRIEFVAGPAALEYFEKEDDELSRSSVLLNSELFGLHDKISSMLAENRSLVKELSNYKETVALEIAKGIVGKKGVIELDLDQSTEIMRKIADTAIKLDKKAAILLVNREGNVIAAAGSESGENAIELAKKRAGKNKFRGGGSERFAEGKLSSA